MPRQGFADLHLHTVASDGTQTLNELVGRCRACRLTTIAVTDHDTISPEVDRRSTTRFGVEVIAGVELKADFDGVSGEILGYFVDPACPRLQRLLERMRRARNARMERMLERCREVTGLELRLEHVRRIAQGNLGRPHLARLLIEAGAAASFDDAFARYISRGRPCYAPIEKPDVREALLAVRESGGVASLAHPCLMKVDDWARFLDWTADAGLSAIEAFYPYERSAGALTIDPHRLVALARERGLLLTGGSDDHGPGSSKETLGRIRLPLSHVDALRARAESTA